MEEEVDYEERGRMGENMMNEEEGESIEEKGEEDVEAEEEVTVTLDIQRFQVRLLSWKRDEFLFIWLYYRYLSLIYILFEPLSLTKLRAVVKSPFIFLGDISSHKKNHI